jgi:PAS domain S-box-containing protein
VAHRSAALHPVKGEELATARLRGRAMQSQPVEIEIPFDALQNWQRIVDLLANIMHVPSAVVCKLEPPNYARYRILASSNSKGNPFPVDDSFAMDIGTFCETVIKSRKPLLVANALEDDRWKRAPELQVGMVSYLGLPLVWPDGHMFGTICVLDDKANPYSDIYQQFLLHCRDVLQADLQTLVRLSDELEGQKAHLRELFARVPDAVVMISREFIVERVNPAFTTLFGYQPEEAIGRRIAELIAPNHGDDEAPSFLDRMFEAVDAFAVETVCTSKDGARLPVAAFCVPVPSDDGGQSAYLICRDLTDSKRFQEEQRRYQEIQLELAHLNRVATLAQLSASIAHELNQPLTGIIANCGTCLQMMTSDPQDFEGVKQAVRRTMRDGKRASQVVERLRALFSNKEPVFEAVDLNDATREMVALSQGELKNAGVILKTGLADELPSVSADRIQLQQVILNLLRNAVDAMTTVDDRPRDLLVTTEKAEDDTVRLSVADSGVGFAPESMARLFDSFYSTKDGGMGVGLAVSRSIIERHHGRLRAALNDGPGATFSFSIPGRAIAP